MPKFTLCIAVDYPDEVTSADAWLSKWAKEVEFLSENYGCGCCVDLYDGEGSVEAITEAGTLSVCSDWTTGTKKRPA